MSREVICFTEDDSAVEICKFFMRTHIRRVPIIRDGCLIGIVSRRDIVSLIAEAKTKMSIAQTGLKDSKVTRLHKSIAAKKAWANRLKDNQEVS